MDANIEMVNHKPLTSIDLSSHDEITEMMNLDNKVSWLLELFIYLFDCITKMIWTDCLNTLISCIYVSEIIMCDGAKLNCWGNHACIIKHISLNSLRFKFRPIEILINNDGNNNNKHSSS